MAPRDATRRRADARAHRRPRGAVAATDGPHRAASTPTPRPARGPTPPPSWPRARPATRWTASSTARSIARSASCARPAITPRPIAPWASACSTTWPWPPRTPWPAGSSACLIIDFDVHHGNGTQHIFAADRRVLYVSSHAWPFYPGTGALQEAGEGEARGFTVNLPMPMGCGDGEYAHLYREIVVPIGRAFDPELVLVSAGFDASGGDPLAGMRLTAAGYAELAAGLPRDRGRRRRRPRGVRPRRRLRPRRPRRRRARPSSGQLLGEPRPKVGPRRARPRSPPSSRRSAVSWRRGGPSANIQDCPHDRLRLRRDRDALAARVGGRRRVRGHGRPRRGRSSTAWRCCPTPRATSTSATSATTASPTWWRATSGCAASTCCTRSAGTRWACPRRTPPSRSGVHPEKWTRENIASMKRQLQRLGFSYPWSREIATCDPEYYRWNQWFFLKMLEKGIAYRSKATVNWCPSCQTVLANEQAEGGECWRCHSVVEERELDQWFLRITAYQDQLLDDMAQLTGLAGPRPRPAAELDRPLAGGGGGLRGRGRGEPAARLHHAHRHHLRRDLHGPGPRASAAGRAAARRARRGGGPRRHRPPARRRTGARASPARSRRRASSPAATRSTRSAASASRSGSATSC